MATRTFSRSLSLNLKPLSDNDFKLEPEKVIVPITSYLSLGAECNAAGDTSSKGITHLLNASISSPNIKVQPPVKYKKIPLKDHCSENVSQFLDEAIEFIDDARRTPGGRVLVYCHAGISRSVTVTVAYLMSRDRMTFDEAYQYVKSRKKDVSPNIGFIGQLQQLEAALRANGNYL